MIVTALVLVAVLLTILGIVASFIQKRSVVVPDERSIDTAAQLDAAIAIQRDIRVAELRRRATDRNYLAYALLGLALIMQIVALAVDHLAHPSIAAISILPAFFTVLIARASRRRYAQRQLDT
jgi:hypothetical protein